MVSSTEVVILDGVNGGGARDLSVIEFSTGCSSGYI